MWELAYVLFGLGVWMGNFYLSGMGLNQITHPWGRNFALGAFILGNGMLLGLLFLNYELQFLLVCVTIGGN